MLFPIDKEALFAAYVMLEPGDMEEDRHDKLFSLGWTTLADHLVRQRDFSEFGVVRQHIWRGYDSNMVQAWASGEAPSLNLVDSPLLGEVTWRGDLIGYKPGYHADGMGGSYHTVTGRAQINVDLSTLFGNASFDQLKHHETLIPDPRSGSQWNDGDLDYDIAIRGNTFHRTDGDEGILTGIFAGEQHEEAVGTLEREDLTAAFGASRPDTDTLNDEEFRFPSITIPHIPDRPDKQEILNLYHDTMLTKARLEAELEPSEEVLIEGPYYVLDLLLGRFEWQLREFGIFESAIVSPQNDQVVVESLHYQDLGPWNQADFQRHVQRDGVDFGVAMFGQTPHVYAIGATPTVLGSGTYNGEMLGVTTEGRVVTGGTTMTVDFDTSDGNIDFTELEHLDGTVFLDGNLSYGLRMRGSTFTQTGGDEGFVTGSFFGDKHMGGVLQRDDLNAAFAGVRP